MQLTRTTLAVACLALATASSASAQLAYGTNQGISGPWPNYLYNAADGSTAIQLFTQVNVHAMAYDQAADVLYALEEGILSVIPKSELGPPSNMPAQLGSINVPTGTALQWQGMTAVGGELYISGGNAIRRVNLPSLSTTQVATLPSGSVLDGLASDPRTGLLYAANNGANPGIYEIDLSFPVTTVFRSAYPPNISDVQGLACDPFGLLYLVLDYSSNIRRFDVDTGSYLPNSPPNAFMDPISTGNAGAAWTIGSPGPGITYCDANPNSTGERGLLRVSGSTIFTDNSINLFAGRLPLNATAYFLTSMTSGPGSPAGQGIFCLGGAVGRYVGPGQVQNTGLDGEVSISIDLTQMPDPQLGLISAAAGQTWYFQCFHRDSIQGVATFNLTSAQSLLLQ